MAATLRVTINKGGLHSLLGKSKFFKQRIKNAYTSDVKQQHRDMLHEFEDNEITQEIEAGPTSENISNTLGGYGNLFSFIGFEYGSDPLKPVRNLLYQQAYIQRVDYNGRGRYALNISVPSKDEILDETPIPWASGRSWIDGIEHGMSGLGQYFYSASGRFDKWSRSLTGLQITTGKKRGAFRNQKYLTQILNNYYRNLRNL